MKYLLPTALVALLGTTLLATNAFGFQTYSTNAVGFDEESSDTTEGSDDFVDDPDSDRDGEIVDADSTLTDNPEQTDVTLPSPDGESSDPIEDITGITPVMSHMDPIEDDVESSDSIENVEAGSPSGSDDELGASAPMLGGAAPMLGAGSPSGSDSENTVTMDTGNDIAQQATEDPWADDGDPSVEDEPDEAVPGPGDLGALVNELNIVTQSLGDETDSNQAVDKKTEEDRS